MNSDKVCPIARLLGLGESVRVQNPKLQKSTGRNPHWYVRPYVASSLPGEKAKQKRMCLGLCSEVSKRKAIAEKTRVMEKINRRSWVLASQIPFGEFIDLWLKNFVRVPGNLSSATQQKYESYVDSRIRPTFGELQMGEIDTRLVDGWLAGLAAEGLAYNTRKDLRGTLSGIFTKARKWGHWKEANPAADVTLGRYRESREKRKLTTEQLRAVLAAVPPEVAMMCKLALCTLRFSEVRGLQEKHLDFTAGIIQVRRRYYLGNVDECKTPRSRRDPPMGILAADLRALCKGNPERELFAGWTYSQASHDLRRAAESLGFYWPGFGFHQFRREAKTGVKLDPHQAMRLGGWSSNDTALLYTLSDQEEQAKAVTEFQKRVLVN
jgi:integrase